MDKCRGLKRKSPDWSSDDEFLSPKRRASQAGGVKKPQGPIWCPVTNCREKFPDLAAFNDHYSAQDGHRRGRVDPPGPDVTNMNDYVHQKHSERVHNFNRARQEKAIRSNQFTINDLFNDEAKSGTPGGDDSWKSQAPGNGSSFSSCVQDGQIPGPFGSSSSAAVSSTEKSGYIYPEIDDDVTMTEDFDRDRPPFTQLEPLNLVFKNNIQTQTDGPQEVQVAGTGSRKRKQEPELAVIKRMRCVGRVGTTNFDYVTETEAWVNPNDPTIIQVTESNANLAKKMTMDLIKMEI